jgi:hypothetical protein
MRRLTALLVSVFVVSLVGVLTVIAQGSALKLPEEISGYLTWQRGNPQKSFEESAHPVAKDVYFNELAAASVSAGTFPHAEGSIFLKERMDPETLTVTTIYGMRKVAGFNASGGDWQYAMFERGEDGTFAGEWMSVEGAAMCIGCHVNAQDKDFTFLNYLPQ